MTYTEHFQKIVEDQLARVEKLKNSSPVPDFAAKEKIIIGTIDGDGIGPVIMDSCRAILEKLLADDIASGKIELRKIEGLTIENRIAKMETVPADVLAAIKECDLLLKGPTTTPGKGDNLPNIESQCKACCDPGKKHRLDLLQRKYRRRVCTGKPRRRDQ